MSDFDDVQVGRILDRREVMRLAGLAGAAALAACTKRLPTATSSPSSSSPASSAASALPGCVVRPALTEGPFFVDEKLKRSDIRSDPSSGAVSPGVPLALAFTVSQIDGSGCKPLEDATVDVWHCDAQGLYSDEASNNTSGKKFLRGYQPTDAKGLAAFQTIYPGWYQGRAVHIHFKIRSTAGFEFTSQLFFDDSLSDSVFAAKPYNTRGSRDTRNSSDGIFGSSDGKLTLDPKKSSEVYAATFDIGLDLSV